VKKLKILRKGNNVMKSLQRELSIDRVQSIMDDASEAQAWNDEINSLMGGTLSLCIV